METEFRWFVGIDWGGESHQVDLPEIDVIWTDIADPHAPMGAHGIGEIGITGVGAARCERNRCC